MCFCSSFCLFITFEHSAQAHLEFPSCSADFCNYKRNLRVICTCYSSCTLYNFKLANQDSFMSPNKLYFSMILFNMLFQSILTMSGIVTRNTTKRFHFTMNKWVSVKPRLFNGDIITQSTGKFSLSRANQDMSFNSIKGFPCLIATWTAPACWSVL